MPWDRLIALVTLAVDIGILWILIREYNFDKIAYEKEQYKKMTKRRKEFKLPEEKLTIGEMQ
jgi:hypothetical protein